MESGVLAAFAKHCCTFYDTMIDPEQLYSLNAIMFDLVTYTCLVPTWDGGCFVLLGGSTFYVKVSLP